jgi:hypothetical protein
MDLEQLIDMHQPLVRLGQYIDGDTGGIITKAKQRSMWASGDEAEYRHRYGKDEPEIGSRAA